MKSPGSEAQLSRPPGSLGGGRHMAAISFSQPARQVAWSSQPWIGSELPATANGDSLDVHNRSGTGRSFLNRKFESISGS